MPYCRFLWDDESCEKIEQHGITIDEFEAVVCDPLENDISRNTDRPIAIGLGDDGRLIVCVYEFVDEFDVIPITAYEVEDDD